MPELPEVEALADHLRRHAAGLTVGRVDVAALSVLKTFDPPPTALHGLAVTGANRWGKYLGLQAGDLHLITHLSRAGWLRWSDKLSAAPLRPGGKSPIALRVHLGKPGDAGRLRPDRGGHPEAPRRVARRRPDEGAADRQPGTRRAVLEPRGTGGRAQGQHRAHQDRHHRSAEIAGIGNAYSDEILHVAKLSPFATASKLTEAQLADLHDAMISVLTDAVSRSVGQGAATLKGEKRSGLRVHARTGMPCPVCGDTVREVSFVDKSFQYCPTCQTGGKILADRRMSKLLK